MVQLNARPFGRAGQDNDRNFTACEVLLITDSLICREQEIDDRCFRGIQKITVVQLVPAPCFGGDDSVVGQRRASPRGVP